MFLSWVNGRDIRRDIRGISVLLLLSLTYCESVVQQDDALSTAVMDDIALSCLQWPDFLSKARRCLKLY